MRGDTLRRDVGRRLRNRLRERAAQHEIAEIGVLFLLSGLPPMPSTARHCSCVSTELVSPSLRAMSHTERKISVVVTGSSTGSARKPNAPPAAPVVATASVARLGGGRPAQRDVQALAQRELRRVVDLAGREIRQPGDHFLDRRAEHARQLHRRDGLSSTASRHSASRSSWDSVVAG